MKRIVTMRMYVLLLLCVFAVCMHAEESHSSISGIHISDAMLPDMSGKQLTNYVNITLSRDFESARKIANIFKAHADFTPNHLPLMRKTMRALDAQIEDHAQMSTATLLVHKSFANALFSGNRIMRKMASDELFAHYIQSFAATARFKKSLFRLYVQVIDRQKDEAVGAHKALIFDAAGNGYYVTEDGQKRKVYIVGPKSEVKIAQAHLVYIKSAYLLMHKRQEFTARSLTGLSVAQERRLKKALLKSVFTQEEIDRIRPPVKE